MGDADFWFLILKVIQSGRFENPGLSPQALGFYFSPIVIVNQ